LDETAESVPGPMTDQLTSVLQLPTLHVTKAEHWVVVADPNIRLAGVQAGVEILPTSGVSGGGVECPPPPQPTNAATSTRIIATKNQETLFIPVSFQVL
jgi:hypothetical protein